MKKDNLIRRDRKVNRLFYAFEVTFPILVNQWVFIVIKINKKCFLPESYIVVFFIKFNFNGLLVIIKNYLHVVFRPVYCIA